MPVAQYGWSGIVLFSIFGAALIFTLLGVVAAMVASTWRHYKTLREWKEKLMRVPLKIGDRVAVNGKCRVRNVEGIHTMDDIGGKLLSMKSDEYEIDADIGIHLYTDPKNDEHGRIPFAG